MVKLSSFKLLNVHFKLQQLSISGGGSLGCQTLYHLAKLGVTNTVLLEKDKLTAGITNIYPDIYI